MVHRQSSIVHRQWGSIECPCLGNVEEEHLHSSYLSVPYCTTAAAGKCSLSSHERTPLLFSFVGTHHHKDVNDQYPRPNMSRLELASSLSALAAASNRQLERKREGERERCQHGLDRLAPRILLSGLDKELTVWVSDTTTTTSLSATEVGTWYASLQASSHTDAKTSRLIDGAMLDWKSRTI